MKRFYLLFLAVMLLHTAKASDPVYLLEKFTEASMFFQNGTFAQARVNYELTTGQIQYLQDGELMELPSDNSVTRIELAGGRTFYQREPCKFYEKVNREKGSVLINWKLDEINMGSQGAYGTTTQAQVVAVRISTLPGGGNQVGDVEHPVYQKEIYKQKCANTYLVSVKGKEYKIKTLKNIYKSFSSKQAEIKKFVEENKLTMNYADDALQIIDYIFTL